ncbi:MAG: 50S ribosomal protein L19 [Candidatus Tagabacteria bacterium CG09_land_8_20_14_0_10_41_14]|uniref:50S ribosomal protein L19 n=2 Tax=Candidatus Tagaibacteriota TaxID=1817918 RepID=A0A2H0WLQ0_9BACT|nr:MAG: 50S ribosomal protein L19 [Candidatus Tagabacteria bacterium CG09_land_8_20_14_0_10_41_14]PJE72849.1 MAG: 50S ribosomal protein L19 [Candidatus Tagabacteria bacterium CG10_big_fil_rev_8_21_14_0_10_40_13]
MKLSPANTDERKKLNIRAGDTVRVWQRILEKGKTRSQAFDGLIISRKHGTETGATFTVRKTIAGVGVELTFPLYSPKIEKIELIGRPKRVRRAKLYYIREKAAKAIRKKMKQTRQIDEVVMTSPAKDSEKEKTEEPKAEE